MWENGGMGIFFDKPTPPPTPLFPFTSEWMWLVTTSLQRFFFMHPTPKNKKKQKILKICAIWTCLNFFKKP